MEFEILVDKFPERCDDCPFAHENRMCIVTKGFKTFSFYSPEDRDRLLKNNRLVDCPLRLKESAKTNIEELLTRFGWAASQCSCGCGYSKDPHKDLADLRKEILDKFADIKKLYASGYGR